MPAFLVNKAPRHVSFQGGAVTLAPDQRFDLHSLPEDTRDATLEALRNDCLVRAMLASGDLVDGTDALAAPAEAPAPKFADAGPGRPARILDPVVKAEAHARAQTKVEARPGRKAARAADPVSQFLATDGE